MFSYLRILLFEYAFLQISIDNQDSIVLCNIIQLTK